MPTLAGAAEKLGVDLAATGIRHRPGTDQFEFPAEAELVIGLPAAIQLENGKGGHRLHRRRAEHGRPQV